MRGDYGNTSPSASTAVPGNVCTAPSISALIVLAAMSAFVFLLAFGAIVHFDPRHALILEIAALAGFALSALIWLIVALVTPAPLLMVDAAKLVARRGYDRLPPQVRERIPEELRIKISGQS